MERLLGLKSPAYYVYVEWLEKCTLKTIRVFEKKTNSPDVGSVFYFENLKIPPHTTV